mgnify:CR=1 FL=1
MANYAKTVINIALGEVGYVEKKSNKSLDSKTANAGSANYTKYGRDMHKLYPAVMDFPAAWCDAFVDWCFQKAYGVSNAKVLLGGSFDDYTVNSAQLYKKKNAWYTKNPKKGDQIFFTNGTRICHTGLVYDVDTTYVYTVEGNTSGDAGVVRNGGGVFKKKYKLTNTKTGQVLAVSGDAKTSGTNVLIEDSDNSNGQRWYIYEYSSGVYMLRPVCATGLVLSVASNSTASMANVQVDTHTGAAGQKFTITKVADVAGLEPVNVGDNFYAKIGSALVNKYFSLSNDNVVITSSSKASAQAWRFVKDSSNAYTIINEKTGKVLTSGTAEGDQVTTTADTGANSQKWYIYQKDGKYMIAPKSVPSCILDVYNDETADGTNIIIWKNKDDGSLNQLFTIEKGSFFDLVDPIDVGTGFIGKMTCSYTNLNWSLSGTNVIIYTPSDAAAQKYVFDRQSDGSYKLTNTKNNYVLTADGTSAGSNVSITGSTNSTNQRWFIYMKEGGYYFRAAGTKSCVIAVTGDLATATMTNVCLEDLSNTKDQKFVITNIGSSSSSSSSSGSTSSGSSSSGSTSTGGNAYATAYQMEVLRKIMYAVETGGQVYGNARYDDFTEAYTNTSQEHAITIGAGQWFATEAKRLLNTIRTQYPSVFASLDTAGIAYDLDNADWSTYKLSKTSAKAKCIQAIISSPEGIKCQDQLIDEQMEKYLAEAANLGVTEIKARMMCANLRHLGGLSAVKRVLNKTKTPYTLDNIYAALQTDTGNQVGTFRSRNSKVYGWVVKYIG